MASISVKQFYKTKVTDNGVQNIPTVTAAVTPDPIESECE